MAQHIELNPVSHLTIGTIGPPGQRVFYFQGAKGSDLISLIMEKQQAAMLAASIESLLKEISHDSTGEEDRESVWKDMRLREPVEPLFRIGNIGLGYNEEIRRIAIVAYELVDEEEKPNVISFWATAVCVLCGWILPFPQPWGLMIAAATSVAVQLSSPWVSREARAHSVQPQEA